MTSGTDKWVFIINPVAGNGFAGTYEPQIEKMIKKHGLKARIVFTTHKGHASDLASEYFTKGYNHIIAVGGDGTVNEIMCKLVNKHHVSFGVIAAGTGNDFIQVLGFPDRFSDSDWDIFLKKETIRIDVGKCNENYFLNGMGLGFDAQVASENYTADGEIKKGNSSKYLWHIVKNLLFYREKDMYTNLNGKKELSKCFINTIAIGRRFAGQYFLTPRAYANDALLDVCMIRELGLINRIKIFSKVPRGEHLEDENVNYYQTNKLSIEFDSEVPHHLDGELYFASRFEVSVIPGGLTIIYNPNGPHFFKL